MTPRLRRQPPLQMLAPGSYFGLPALPSDFRIADIRLPSHSQTSQLEALYRQAIEGGRWKYDPLPMVLRGIGHVPDYHILAALQGDNNGVGKIVGTVRAILLPDSNLVFGSCLVVDREFQRRGLAIPLIGAAMAVADHDSRHSERGGIRGAVLGVDDDPRMRAFHGRWGVWYLDQNELPFILPSADGAEPQERLWGMRLEAAPVPPVVSAGYLEAVLDDLKRVEIQLGYRPDAAEAAYSYLKGRLAGKEGLSLYSAADYPAQATDGQIKASRSE